MARARLIKDDLRYLLFAEIYHKLEEPKAKRKAFTILETAIQCVARKGLNGLTLEMVAREAGVTRPLVKYYFLDLEGLRRAAIQYIRLLFQNLAVNAMLKETREDAMLLAYVEICFLWVDNFRTHAVAWFHFLNSCSANKLNRELNTEAVIVGEERLASLLRQGKAAGVFHCVDPAVSAKMIQVFITGAMITYVAENLPNSKIFIRHVREQCLEMTLATKVRKGSTPI